MKVLHLVSEKTWRGGEQQIAYLITVLNQLGHENIAAVRKKSVFEKYCISNKITYYTYSFKNSLDILTSVGIRRLIKAKSPDIIHIHSSKAHGIMALIYLMGIKVPSVLSRRVDFPLKSFGFSQWKYNLKAIKKIICVSDTIRKIVINSVNNPDRVLTIYDGIDIKKHVIAENSNFLRSKYGLKKDAILIGNTSALADHKDYFTFINTASSYIKTGKANVYFFIIGKGNQEEQIVNYIQEKKLEERVFMTGFLNNIPSILKELDLFLMTSKTEGLGTSVLDAFASKLAVVSTNGGGLSEIVIHQKTGLLADVFNHDQLASHISYLLKNTEDAAKLTSSAFDFVKDYSMEIMANKTLEIYKQVI